MAIGDINNDGWEDIYFTGNQVENKLYLNLGNWRFEDITRAAGVACQDVWSTGVVMVDVNADGWLDIYICKSGPPDVTGVRHNELFINNGDLTFTESSKEWGLAVTGLSTHATFFDFDRDGDLDCYILSNSIRPIGGFDLQKDSRETPDPSGQGARFMRNEGTHFIDVTTQVGIYSSAIGFGLGVTATDVNNDGWIDLYVSNDFFERDYLYINQQNGSFRERLEEYVMSASFGSMGADAADINNDGLLDIFVTEMLPSDHARYKTKAVFENWEKQQRGFSQGYGVQVPRNVIHVNQEGDQFSEMGRLFGIEATDWSWGALLFDVDLDGWKDIFVANGIARDLTDQDYVNFMADPQTIRSLVDTKGMVIGELLDKVPSEPLVNPLFKNLSGDDFANVSMEWGLSRASFSNGAAYGDLDNDGDFDLVISNINEPAFVVENGTRQMDSVHFLAIDLRSRSKNTHAIGAKVSIFTGGQRQMVEVNPARGFMSSSSYRVIAGLGFEEKVDSVEVDWGDGLFSVLHNPDVDTLLRIEDNRLLQKSTADRNSDAVPYFRETLYTSFYPHRENEFNDFDRDRLLYHMLSNEGPRACKGDANGDGLDDVFVGGAKGQPGRLYLQGPGGTFRSADEPLFSQDSASEDCGCVFFDADRDGDLDLYVASGGYEYPTTSTALADRLYLNEGRGHFRKEASQVLPASKFESTSAVAAADFDGDGDMDLFVGVRLDPFQYGVPTNGYLLENDGRGKFREVSGERAPVLKGMGMITDALWSDYDRDGDPDLLVVGEWLGVRLFNNAGGKFTEVSGRLGLSGTEGWWNKVIAHDLDGDGDEDYVLGNHGLNSRFKASKEKPVTMWVNDFDQNGTVEQIICRWWGDTQYPMALRHDLLSQLPGLKKKYLKYSSYKDQRVEDIFTADQLKRALKWEARELRTAVLWNEGGTLRLAPLPVEAQYAPMYGLAAGDFTGDGKADIVVGGNQYRAKPEVGRYDASYGALFAGDGRGGFTFVRSSESGLKIRGEVRSIVPLRVQGKPHLFFALNNDVPKLFMLQK